MTEADRPRINLLDVNVVVALLVSDHAHHSTARMWLDQARRSETRLLIPEEVCASFVRLASSIGLSPSFGGMIEAIASVRRFHQAPMVEILIPSPRRLDRALDLADHLQLTSKEVPDIFLAALAIESGATLITFDRGFARFPDLSVEILIP